jgi:hypothetical protein
MCKLSRRHLYGNCDGPEYYWLRRLELTPRKPHAAGAAVPPAPLNLPAPSTP